VAVHIIERDLIKEHTRAGLDAARARGRRGGRPAVLSPVKRKQATRMIAQRLTEQHRVTIEHLRPARGRISGSG